MWTVIIRPTILKDLQDFQRANQAVELVIF